MFKLDSLFGDVSRIRNTFFLDERNENMLADGLYGQGAK